MDGRRAQVRADHVDVAAVDGVAGGRAGAGDLVVKRPADVGGLDLRVARVGQGFHLALGEGANPVADGDSLVEFGLLAEGVLGSSAPPRSSRDA